MDAPAAATPSPRDGTVRRAVAPLIGAYASFGQFWGAWTVLVLDYLERHGLSEGDLGIQMSVLAIVSILTMTLLTPRLQALPLARTIPLGLGLGEGALLWLGMGALGVGNGLIDVYVNVAAQGLEAKHRRPVLQWTHASYAVGGVLGALGAGLASRAGVSFGSSLAVSALVLFATAAWNALAPAVRALARGARTESALSLAVFSRTRRLILPAIVVMFAFLVEGSMDVWSGAYLRTTLEASPLVAGIAFALFSGSLAVGRLTAGRVLFGLGYDRTIQVAGAGSFVSGMAAALTSSPAVAGVAFLFLGFFISSAAPAAFGVVGETDADPSLAVSGISTVGYSGFVIGPAIMGALAEGSGLRLTMIVIAFSTLGVLAGGALDAARTRARAAEATVSDDR
jgi:hypothetical protein